MVIFLICGEPSFLARSGSFYSSSVLYDRFEGQASGQCIAFTPKAANQVGRVPWI